MGQILRCSSPLHVSSSIVASKLVWLQYTCSKMKTICILLALAANLAPALAQSTSSTSVTAQSTTPVHVQTVGNYVYQGCYNDTASTGNARTLAQSTYNSGSAMTVEACGAYCANLGYAWMGVEYSQQW